MKQQLIVYARTNFHFLFKMHVTKRFEVVNNTFKLSDHNCIAFLQFTALIIFEYQKIKLPKRRIIVEMKISEGLFLKDGN